MSNEYDESNIQVLEGLTAVRHRPAMYIGSVDQYGLHHLIWEIIDNSIDEAMAGVCKNIKVTIRKTKTGLESITVLDDGRGIPIEIHPVYGISSLELVTTKLHSGGKFDHSSYRVSGGLHGVGIAVVNALSSWMQVKVAGRRKNVVYQEYMRGETITQGILELEEDWGFKSGTKVTFVPDTEIFTEAHFNVNTIKTRLRELAFLNKGLRIVLVDMRNTPDAKDDEIFAIENAIFNEIDDSDIETDDENPTWIFQYDGGIKAYVDLLTPNRLHDELPYFEEEGDTTVEISLAYDKQERDLVYTFVNNINTRHGGTHLSGFKAGLTRAINAYVQKNEHLIKDQRLRKELKLKKSVFSGNDVREGLVAVVSAKVMDPQFEGQTKSKLGNSEVKGIVESACYENILEFLNKNPDAAKVIVDKCVSAATFRNKIKQLRDAEKRTTGKGTGKLVDCSTKDVERRELFLVEGDSAGGSAIEGRFSEFQAILPLRGKVINVEKARLDKALKNREILEIIKAVGGGYRENFDITKVKYKKIILLMDADVDGHHIVCLLLTFFFRYMPELIDEGYLYVAQPPLFRLKKGKKESYVLSEGERDKTLDEWGKYVEISRFKGLGEMNPLQLRETVMDPKNRNLLRVNKDNIIEAERMFNVLMGEHVTPRREFITSRALEVENLDI